MSKLSDVFKQRIMDQLKDRVCATSLVIRVRKIRYGEVLLEVSTADKDGPLTMLAEAWIGEGCDMTLSGFSEVFSIKIV